MFGLEKDEVVRRNTLIYLWARFISNTGYRIFSRSHVENPGDLRPLKKDKGVFLYTGLHKSLWETTGVLSSIYFEKLPIPYTGMGDNLVKGKFFQNLVSKAGVFMVKRAKTRREVIQSSKKLKNYLLYYMAHGTDVAIYPEGTRRNIPEKGHYGNFFPTAFEAVLEYEKTRDEILAEDKKLTPRDVYVIPFNVDYSKVREDFEYVKSGDSRPTTLHILDSLKMLKRLGDLYISFGMPIKVGDHLDKTRKELAVYTRERCLELVKILPINIAALSILDAHEGGQLTTDRVLESIGRNLEKLDSFKDRFRGFEAGESPRDILDKVARYEGAFKNIDTEHIPLYRLYSGYINHYTDVGDE